MFIETCICPHVLGTKVNKAGALPLLGSKAVSGETRQREGPGQDWHSHWTLWPPWWKQGWLSIILKSKWIGATEKSEVLEMFSSKTFQLPPGNRKYFFLFLLMATFINEIHVKECLLNPLRKSLKFKFNSWVMRPGNPDCRILSAFHYLKPWYHRQMA